MRCASRSRARSPSSRCARRARAPRACRLPGTTRRSPAGRISTRHPPSIDQVIITGKAQLEESLALLNKHKTNDFRTSMLMKWSRPGASAGLGGGDGDGGGGGGGGGGGYSPRTLSKKQAELRQLQQDKNAMVSELRDCDDQLEQIELEKARLEEAVDDDADITEALEELREQLSATKKEKLAQLQLVETAERALATDLGVALESAGAPSLGGGGGVGARGDVGVGGGMGGSGGGLDASSVAFMRGCAGLWKKLESSSIERLNVGQQEAMGVKDLLRASNDQIDSIAAELKRLSASASSRNDGGELSTLLYDLLMDSASCRKRLNDYTEGAWRPLPVPSGPCLLGALSSSRSPPQHQGQPRLGPRLPTPGQRVLRARACACACVCACACACASRAVWQVCSYRRRKSSTTSRRHSKLRGDRVREHVRGTACCCTAGCIQNTFKKTSRVAAQL